MSHIKSKNTVWLITGTSTGIGRTIAEKLLELGFMVAGTARNINKIKDLINNYPSNFLGIEADVTQKQDNESTVQQTMNRFGKIDVLVNNAGYGLTGAFEEISLEQIRSQFETNFFGLVEMTQLVLPIMRQNNNGYIFNISSIAGLRGMRSMSIYCASKFAVEGFSEALAQEVNPFNIKVCLVEPGPYRTDWAGRSLVKTDIMSQNLDSDYKSLNDATNKTFEQVSGNQPGKPEQIASVLISASQQEKLPIHLIFGDEAIKVWDDYQKKLNESSFLQVFPHTQYHI